LEDSAIRMHQAVLNAMTGGAELFLREKVRRLESLGVTPAVQGLHPPRFEPLLNDVLTDCPFFRQILVADASGTILGGATRDRRVRLQALIGTPLATLVSPLAGVPVGSVPGHLLSQAFARAVRTRVAQTLSGSGAADAEGGLTLLVPIVGFGEEERVSGMLIARATLQGGDVQEILDAFPCGTGEYLCLLDQAGEILARRNPASGADANPGGSDGARQVALWPGSWDLEPRGLQGSLGGMPPGQVLSSRVARFQWPHAAWVQARQANRVQTFLCEVEGRTDLLSVSYCPPLGGWILQGKPAVEAFRFRDTLRGTLLLVAFLALALSTVAGVYLSRSVSRPVQELINGLHRVKEGEYSSRVPADGDDELASAGGALNDLAGLLQRRRLLGSIWESLKQRDRKP
jgi:HAMP domain-containing protein